MAVRAPAAPTGFIDRSALIARNQVLITEPDNILDDQQFILDREELVVSWGHRKFTYTNATAAWTTVWRSWVTHPDHCGAVSGGGTTIAGEFAVRLTCDTNNWEVGIYNSATATRYSFTTPVAGCTATWCGNSGAPGWTAITLAADGTENELSLQVRCPGAAGADLDLYGLGVFA